MEDLTDRQQEILDLIRTTVADRGYPPSVREIGDVLGLRSPSTVHSHLSSLVRSGYLRPRPGTSPSSAGSLPARPYSQRNRSRKS